MRVKHSDAQLKLSCYVKKKRSATQPVTPKFDINNGIFLDLDEFSIFNSSVDKLDKPRTKSSSKSVGCHDLLGSSAIKATRERGSKSSKLVQGVELLCCNHGLQQSALDLLESENYR